MIIIEKRKTSLMFKVKKIMKKTIIFLFLLLGNPFLLHHKWYTAKYVIV